MPVDGGGLVELVDEAHPQPIALARTQFHARRLAAVGPGRSAAAGDQFEVERRGDQLKVVGPGIQWAPQPVAGAAGTEANHAKAHQAAENLSASKGHGGQAPLGKNGLSHRLIEPASVGPAYGAHKIHPAIEKDKGKHPHWPRPMGAARRRM
ncbi:hypothetical protein D3C84_547180 [compost metagenome]